MTQAKQLFTPTLASMLSRTHLLGRRTELLQLSLIVLISLLTTFVDLFNLLSIVVIMAISILLYLYPWLIWAAMGMLIPITSRYRVGPVSATDLLLFSAILIWIVQSIRRRRMPLYLHSALPVLTVYIGVTMVSAFLAQDLGEALTEMLKWVQFAIVLVLAPAMTGGKYARFMIAGLMVGGITQALLGTYQFVFQVGPEWFAVLGSYMRASGSFRQPNPYAGYLGLTLPVVFSLTIWSLQGWQAANYRTRALAPLIWYASALVIILAGLIASWSRGGWLGAAAGLAVVYVATQANLRMKIACTSLIICVALLIGFTVQGAVPGTVRDRMEGIPAYLGNGEILTQPTTDANFSIQERLAHWVAAQRMWSQSPWLGVGVGNYASIYPSVRLLAWEEPLGHAHNYYLHVLAETGIIGFLAFALVWSVLMQRAIVALLWASRRSLQWAIGAGLLGLLAHLAVHSMVDNLFVQGIYLHIAAWFALLEIAGRIPASFRT